MSSSPSPVSAPPHILELLDRLHEKSQTQEKAIDKAALDPQTFDNVMRDKFIALDQDKSQFVYSVCRAINAKNVVEAGTSFGVSTIYLSLAVGSNIESSGGTGTVIATEYEATKAGKARSYWAEAGELVTRYIDLREGDLRQTLKKEVPSVDFLLLDIWQEMALPTLLLIQPKMRHGAVVITDNTVSGAPKYKELLAYLRAPDSGFINVTLPYSGGLEMSVYTPKVAVLTESV